MNCNQVNWNQVNWNQVNWNQVNWNEPNFIKCSFENESISNWKSHDQKINEKFKWRKQQAKWWFEVALLFGQTNLSFKIIQNENQFF